MSKLLRLDNRKCTSHCYSVLKDQPDEDAIHLVVWRLDGDSLISTRVILHGEKLLDCIVHSFGVRVLIDDYIKDKEAYTLGLLKVDSMDESINLFRKALDIAQQQRHAISISWYRTRAGNTRMSDCGVQKKRNYSLPWDRKDDAIKKLNAYEGDYPIKRPLRGPTALLADARRLLNCSSKQEAPTAQVAVDHDVPNGLSGLVDDRTPPTLSELAEDSGLVSVPVPAPKPRQEAPKDPVKTLRGLKEPVTERWTKQEWQEALIAHWPKDWSSPTKVALQAKYDHWLTKPPLGIIKLGMSLEDFYSQLDRDCKGMVIDLDALGEV